MIDDIMSETMNILLLEDDDVDVEAVRREFKKRNISNPLHHAASGVDALEKLRGQNQNQKIPQPCVMLVDINLPKMNGLEFLREVRNDDLLKQSIAFMLTTSERNSDIATAYELNAAGYFLKDNIGKLADLLDIYRHINRFYEKRSGF